MINMKLMHKLLIVAAIPVFPNIGFLLCFTELLRQSESAGAREHRAREAIGSLSSLYERVTECSRSVGVAVLASKDPSSSIVRFHASMSSVPRDIANLKQTLSNDLNAIAEADNLATTLDDALAIVDEVFRRLQAGERLRALEKLRELRDTVPKLISKLDALQSVCGRIADENYDAGLQTRQTLQLLIWLACFANAVIAAGVVWYLNRNVTTRINSVMENTRRLAKGEPLLPALSEFDEIAQLSRVFNEMAAALRLAQEKESAIINTMPAGLITTDGAGKIQTVNETACLLWGLDSVDLIGSPFSSVSISERGVRSTESFADLIVRAENKPVETYIGSRSAGCIAVDISMRRFATAQTDLWLIAVIDITLRKQSERLKQEFISMISHDLRTPLTSIQIFVSLLAKGAFGEISELAQKKAESCERSSSRLIRLVNDLLDIERMEAGLLPLNRQSIILSVVIGRAIEAIKVLAENNGLEITAELGVDPAIHVDCDRIVQVLVNLLGNAIKFSFTDGTIRIKAERRESEVMVKVIDQGRGIPEKAQSVLFNRFMQAELADATELKGTGLGLAICKTVIEQHGGAIGFESKFGCGSSFWFTLPIFTENDPNSPIEVIVDE